MKTNLITIGLHAENASNIKTLTGVYSNDFESKQYVTYSIDNGLATITELKSCYGSTIALPLPFVLPVNDLGSGVIQSIQINADTLRAYTAICPNKAWAERRAMRSLPTPSQTLLADYIGLF